MTKIIKTEGNIRKSYRLYKKVSEQPIDIKHYIYLANDYNKFLMEKVFAGEEVTLPLKLGTLSIIGKKQEIKYNEKGELILPPNWGKTKELWDSNPIAKENKKIIYCLNEQTNGVRYKVFWSKKLMMVENKILYSLKMTRENKRRINKEIVSGKEYFVKHFKASNHD